MAGTALAVERLPKLQSTFDTRTVNELVLMFRAGQLNLEPGFQRKSVWGRTDRRRLVQTLVEHCPVPSIFLYERHEDGSVIYDVIDGKQRIETILMFLAEGRFKQHWFNAKIDLGDGLKWWSWKDFSKSRPEICSALMTYKLPVVQVTGELSEIIDLFVKINSTGKSLTSGEKRHAKYNTSTLLKKAELLVRKYQPYLLGQKILSRSQLERMKGTELFSELLLSIQSGGVINKKVAIDKAIGNESINGNTLTRISKEFVATFNATKKMFGKDKKGDFFKTTRFHNTAEFYSLFMIVWNMRKEKLVLGDRKRNEAAMAMLRKLGAGVDELRDQLRKAQPAKANQRMFADYLLTVQGDTDSAATRKRRAEVLEPMLFPLFERKDTKRLFSSEQRRIIWNREEQHFCAGKNCPTPKKALGWEDVTIDHVLAWIKGGQTALKNAQILCRHCNSKKGGR
jgi:hypothetical protein